MSVRQTENLPERKTGWKEPILIMKTDNVNANNAAIEQIKELPKSNCIQQPQGKK